MGFDFVQFIFRDRNLYLSVGLNILLWRALHSQNSSDNMLSVIKEIPERNLDNRWPCSYKKGKASHREG